MDPKRAKALGDAGLAAKREKVEVEEECCFEGFVVEVVAAAVVVVDFVDLGAEALLFPTFVEVSKECSTTTTTTVQLLAIEFRNYLARLSFASLH